MFDVLATNLVLIGLLLLFSTFPIFLQRKLVRFMIVDVLSSISHSHVCLVVVQN